MDSEKRTADVEDYAYITVNIIITWGKQSDNEEYFQVNPNEKNEANKSN